MQIVNRTARDAFIAWEWADAAARLEWRVVAVFLDPLSGLFMVWAETHRATPPDEWDKELVRQREARDAHA